MTAELPKITLKPHKGGTFRSRHPWVLAKSIVEPDHPPADGEEVDLVRDRGLLDRPRNLQQPQPYPGATV